MRSPSLDRSNGWHEEIRSNSPKGEDMSGQKSPSAMRQVRFRGGNQDTVEKLRSLKPDKQRIPDLQGIQLFRGPNHLILQERWSSAQAAEQETKNNAAYLNLLGEMQEAAGEKPETMGIFEEISSS